MRFPFCEKTSETRSCQCPWPNQFGLCPIYLYLVLWMLIHIRRLVLVRSEYLISSLLCISERYSPIHRLGKRWWGIYESYATCYLFYSKKLINLIFIPLLVFFHWPGNFGSAITRKLKLHSHVWILVIISIWIFLLQHYANFFQNCLTRF